MRANCARLKAELGDGAELCAVVKADGYGHGAEDCAAAALAGGATRLAVATAVEAEELGRVFPHVPLLTMGALSAEEVDVALGAGVGAGGLARGLPRPARRPRARSRGRPARVHVKFDSGMGRLGNPDPDEVLALARACAADPDLELAGVWTHFATADEPESDLLRRAARALRPRRRGGPGRVPRHVSSTPPTAPPSSASRRSHFDMARCGVAIYGLDPFQGDPAERGLRAGALAALLRRRRQALRRPGTSAGYGQTWAAPEETWVGVVPLGYGDGVRRGLSNNAEVLVGGRRRPAGRHRLDGQRDDRPRPRDRGRARRRGGPDRRPGRGADPRRGAGGAAGHDQLRGHLRDLRRGCRGGRREPRRATCARAPLVAAASRRALGEGEGAWIVGGAVRDAALGERGRRPRPRGRRRPGRRRPGDRQRARRARLRALGRVRDLAVVADAPRLAGRRRPRCAAAAIEADLAERDFTIGAVAVPLAGGEPIDPYDGLGDLERRLPAGGRRAQLRRATRCGCCGRRGSRPSSGSRSTRDGRASPAPPPPAPPSRPASASWPSCGSCSAAPTRCAACALLDELGLTAGRPARAGRRCAGSSRARTTTSTSTATRWRCWSTRSRSRRDLERFAGERADEVAALLDEPLADEMSRGTALRFGALFHDIGKPATRAEQRRLRRLPRPRPASGRRSSTTICAPPARQPPPHPAPAGAGPAPPAARLPDPRGAAAAAPRPRVPAGDRTGRASTSPCSPSPTGSRPAAPARWPARRWSRPTSTLAREMIAAGARLAPRRAAGAAAARRRAGRRAGDRARAPSWAKLMAELEAAQYAGEVADRAAALEHAPTGSRWTA